MTPNPNKMQPKVSMIDGNLASNAKSMQIRQVMSQDMMGPGTYFLNKKGELQNYSNLKNQKKEKNARFPVIFVLISKIKAKQSFIYKLLKGQKSCTE